MPIIKTPQDLAAVIRSRRKQLGWDQATLARQVGVSRQWVIDVEKGKPRAELELILRSLNALGLSLTSAVLEGPATQNAVDASRARPDRTRRSKSRSDIASAPRSATTEESSTSAAARLAELSRSQPNSAAAAILRSSSVLRQAAQLAPPRQSKSAAEILRSSTTLRAVAQLARPPLPKSAAEILRGSSTLRAATQFVERPQPQSAAQLLAATGTRKGKADAATSPRAPQPRKPKDAKTKAKKKPASEKSAASDSSVKKGKKR